MITSFKLLQKKRQPANRLFFFLLLNNAEVFGLYFENNVPLSLWLTHGPLVFCVLRVTGCYKKKFEGKKTCRYAFFSHCKSNCKFIKYVLLFAIQLLSVKKQFFFSLFCGAFHILFNEIQWINNSFY